MYQIQLKYKIWRFQKPDHLCFLVIGFWYLALFIHKKANNKQLKMKNLYQKVLASQSSLNKAFLPK